MRWTSDKFLFMQTRIFIFVGIVNDDGFCVWDGE